MQQFLHAYGYMHVWLLRLSTATSWRNGLCFNTDSCVLKEDAFKVVGRDVDSQITMLPATDSLS